VVKIDIEKHMVKGLGQSMAL